jgi:hypothetical protein
MPDPDPAAEHLRVIRQLMERATVYRSISAPVALVGGVGALVLAWSHHEHGMTWRLFLRNWVGLFAVLAFLNLGLLWRDAVGRGLPLLNSGMKLALRALAPPLMVGGLVGFVIAWKNHDMGFVASLWAMCYGLALLATASKAAGALALFVLVTGPFAALGAKLGPLLAGLAILTLLAGNLAALAATDVKRTLALSGVAHAGFLLAAIAVAVVAPNVHYETIGGLAISAEHAIYFYLYAYILGTFLTSAALVSLPAAPSHDLTAHLQQLKAHQQQQHQVQHLQ